MYNYILTFFKKNIKQNKQEPKDNSICFSIGTNGKIKTIVSIIDNEEYSCEDLASLLYHLNEGHFTKHILDTLFEISEKHPEYALFISDLITKWSEKIKKDPEYSKDIPIIAPSQFYTYLGK
jgi:hypothetical protein